MNHSEVASHLPANVEAVRDQAALTLWRAGRDTVDIAVVLGITEAQAYAAVSRRTGRAAC